MRIYIASVAPQHFLYFFPLPQGHWSLRPILGVARTTGMPIQRFHALLRPIRIVAKTCSTLTRIFARARLFLCWLPLRGLFR